jgi:pimeloyl-ACP methyl ester carboxylesterase
MISIPFTHYEMTKINTKNSELYYCEQLPTEKEKGIVIIIPGWSYNADTWSTILLTNPLLKKNYRAFIVLNRGYNNKYFKNNNTMKQFSTDIYDFIKMKNLNNITLLGHSAGCAYIWNMIYLFGEKRFKNYIIVDESPILLKELSNDNLKKEFAVYDKASLSEAVASLNSDKKTADNYKTSFTKKLFTKSFNKNNPEMIKKFEMGTLDFNNKVLADILENIVNNVNMEKLFTTKKIMKPALLIGGKESIVPFESIQYQTRFYKKSTVYIFTKGSSHSMFIENYKTFNKILNKFLKNDKNNKTQKRKTKRKIKSKNKTIKKTIKKKNN